MGLAAWMGGVDVQRFNEYFSSLPKEPDPEMKKKHQQAAGRKLPGMKPEMTAFLEEATGRRPST